MIFKALDGAYSVSSAETGIEFYIDRLRRDRHELMGELSVSAGMLSSSRAIDGVLSAGTFNLSSPRARVERANILANRSRTAAEIDWHGMLEEVCQRILAAERTGAPAIDLSQMPRPEADPHYDIDDFVFPQHHGTILFGDGGAMKSLFALYVAGRLVERGLSVAVFDWELDAAEHRLRLERLFPEHMPAVRHVRCDRPLIYEVDRLQKIKVANALDFVVLDSAGYACYGKPEDAEQALAYFRAVRQLRIGSLHIAHITKGDDNDKKPFGSGFWHNSARSTWFAKLAETPMASGIRTIGLFHRKANLGPQHAPIGFDVVFGHERTVFRRVSLADVDELAPSLPLSVRIKASVQHQPKAFATIAEELGVKVNSIIQAVKRDSKTFTKVSGTDGVHRVALLEFRRAEG